jgi:hypothetical protein
MERGDWEGFFACLDRDDLIRIAENGVARFMAGGETTTTRFAGLCGEHAVPEENILALGALLQQMAESARASVEQAHSPDPASMLQQSLRHKQIVDAYQQTLKQTLKAVPDLPRFTAALESALRAAAGGGSVSSRLFADEVLENVSIEGSKAWATRRSAQSRSEDIAFVRRQGLWSLRLFAKRPASRRG